MVIPVRISMDWHGLRLRKILDGSLPPSEIHQGDS